MTPAHLIACGALLAGAGIMALPWPGPAAPATARHRSAGSGRRDGPSAGASRPVRLVATLGAGLSVAVLVEGFSGLASGAVVAAASYAVIARMPSRSVRQERAQAAADLPLVADLLAAVLRAGAPVDQAAVAVGSAVAGPVGIRLTQAGRALRLGAPPDEAWLYLGDVVDAGRLVRAAVRSSASGAALSRSLARLAGELRAARATAADAAARRAGVLVVLPLGLCFLPAFVLAGLVPVVVAVLGDVW